jgi:F-type H+-transporting ATPase subunit delta
MAENSTVARPYARAVFELAHESGSFPAWSAFLERAATVVMDERVAGLIDSPQLSRTDLADLMIDLAGDEAGEQGHNLIRLLAENDRLPFLPEITAEYAALRDAAENVVDVEVVSAVALTDQEKEEYAAAMRKRLGRDVRLECRVDESLLGGAIIRAGDVVIDGSVSGSLQQLASAVSH